MNASAKKALAKIDSIEMFSKDGWKRVHKECGHLQNAPHLHSDIALAQGFAEYQNIWFEDNDIDDDNWSEEDEKNTEKMLLSRFVDYLQRD